MSTQGDSTKFEARCISENEFFFFLMSLFSTIHLDVCLKIVRFVFLKTQQLYLTIEWVDSQYFI